MIFVAIIIVVQLFVLSSHLGHLHKHTIRNELLLEWLVVRKGGNPDQITHSYPVDGEIGGPNHGI